MSTRSTIQALLVLVCVLPLQSQTETGLIAGVVTDAANHACPLATITVRSAATAALRKTSTSSGGVYNVPDLLPGTYTVEASAPDYSPSSRTVAIVAGAHLRTNFQLAVAGPAAANAAPAETGTITQTIELAIPREDVEDLPSLNRNPYQFVELSGAVSDAGAGTRGAGFAMNGQRESSTNILLDGANNNNEFAGSIGQPVPPDSVEEVVVIMGAATAEYGRAAGGTVGAITRSGANELHGSGYEFNRVSRLTSNTYKDNAGGVKESAFTRNEFGYETGGPVVHNRIFFFTNTEAVLTRSHAMDFAWVPTPQLLALTAHDTQSFFQSLGQLRPDASVTQNVTLNNLTAVSGASPCIGLACATLPAGLPLFEHVAYTVPGDSGGGFPQTSVNSLARIDDRISSRAWLYARYAVYSQREPSGTLSSSPYSNYDLRQTQLDNSLSASLIQSWNSRWTSETALDFHRFSIFQQGLTSRGVVPTMYANPLAPVNIGPDPVAFPGYNPFTPSGAGAFGGPENLAELRHGTSWSKGRHLIRLGAAFDTIRDNRTDAAYQTAVDSLSNGGGLGPALNGLLSGQFTQMEVAINPQGKFPCVNGVTTPACSLTLPLSAPDFGRSNIFNEGALFVQDYWQVNRRLAINLGVRWEHFGVQHDKDPNLDSNWYAPGVGFADDSLGTYLRNGALEPASQSSVGALWRPDWRDFAPRIGFAWDVWGHGTVRGGYGIAYERNFGNVTFNVMQNLPNYTVLDVPGSVTTNNFGPLIGTGTLALPPAGARIIDPDLKTAYAHLWNMSLQRSLTAGVSYSLDYSGSKGLNLYSISYPNQFGFGNLVLGDPCNGTGDCFSQPNPGYGENVGYRGNQGFSSSQSLSNSLKVTNLFHRGISMVVNYTWSHTVDNLSSTFFEAGGQGVASQYGNQNITTNNGDFDTGLLDPYQPALDKGDADFDIRHRVTVAGSWQLPGWKKQGVLGSLTRGWRLSPILTARSGQPFSVFDTSAQTLDLSAPRATFVGSHPTGPNSFVPSPTIPDLVHLITFLPAQLSREPNPLTPGAPWAANMSARNSFRAPGFWNLDISMQKDARLTEHLTLQLRAEFYNALNHANLYVIGTSADVGQSNTVDACFGCTGSTYDRRQVQLAGKLIF